MNFRRTHQFKKDLKKYKNQEKTLIALKKVIDYLEAGIEFPKKYCNHPLGGNSKGSFDCHIQPDCLLIYTIDKNCITLEGMGNHSELFKNSEA